MSALWLIPIVGFLLGSIPVGFLLVRASGGGDVRATGSGNIGATNVLRTAGRKLGLLTLLLDAAKGWLALLLAIRLAPGHPGLLAATLLLTVAGHIFTPWLGFRGGKGVATGLGAFLALAPLALVGAVVVFALVLALWRFVSLASICAAIALPLLLLLPPSPAPGVIEAAAAGVALLVVYRHRANLDRLRRGLEPRLGERPSGAGFRRGGAA